MKYGLHKKDSVIVAKSCIVNENKIPVVDGATFSFCTMQEYNDAVLPVTPSFDPNDFDEWLMATYIDTPLEQYFPVLSRATEKNNPRGYQQMFDFATAKSVPANIMSDIQSKLIELGANVQ